MPPLCLDPVQKWANSYVISPTILVTSESLSRYGTSERKHLPQYPSLMTRVFRGLPHSSQHTVVNLCLPTPLGSKSDQTPILSLIKPVCIRSVIGNMLPKL